MMASFVQKALVICTLVSYSCGNGLDIRQYDATTSDHFHKIIIEPRSEYVYVGGRNALFKFDSNLGQPLDVSKTGPLEDGIECNPAMWPCASAHIMDNDVKVMDILPGSDHLLYCGTIKQGLCMTFPLKGSLSEGHFLDEFNKVNFVGSRSATYAFFGSGPENKYPVLYVGQSFDQRPLDLFPKAISARKLKDVDGRFNISYVYENPHHKLWTAIDIDPYYKQNYIIDYVFGFEHDGFSYFLTVQREQPGEYLEYKTHLIRICQDDPAFSSYTEVELSCKKKNGFTTFFNIAKSAYVAHIGKDLSEKFNIDYNEKMLYILFAKSKPASKEIDPRYGSGLCMYSMKQITSYFTDTQRDCYRGHGSILPWVDSRQPKCQSDHSIALGISDSWCGNSLNVGIGSRYPLQTETNVTSRDFSATSIGIFIYKDKTIAVFGTNHGKLVKVLIDGTNSPPYATIDVASDLPQPASVVGDMKFDQTQEHLYVLTGNRISKVQVQSCLVYADCGVCVMSKDPLNCGWCEDHCSPEEECTTGSTWTQKSCPPQIQQFWPNTGPTKGGTKITILGSQFGNTSAASNVKATVALEDCTVEFSNTSFIVCTTGETNEPRDRGIEVAIVDSSKTTVDFIIRGEARSGHDSFSYRTPVMKSFHPIMGPKAGGTKLTISGENLDVGSFLDIQVAFHPCTPISISSTAIICSTSTWGPQLELIPYSRRKRSATEGTVNVTIDNAKLSLPQLFTYMDDPEIVAVNPRSSILSGGLLITVEGSNLHVVDEPKLTAVVDGYPHQEFSAQCAANHDGDKMICKSPNIKKTSYPVRPGFVISVRIHFLMDGVLNLTNFADNNPIMSRFSYHVDPQIDQFDNQGVRYFYKNEKDLEIMGKYLDLAISKKDIHVMIGEDECNVTKLDWSVIVCEPQRPSNPEDEDLPHRVEVHIGNVISHIGELRFTERRIELLIMFISAPVLAVVPLVVIAIVCWMKKNKKCGFKEKQHQQVRYTPGEIGVDLGYGSPADQVYRLNQNPYWSSSHHFRSNILSEVRAPLLDDDSRRFIEESHLLIPRERLLLLDIIGQGHFGCVYMGLMKQEGTKEEKHVAVKTLKTLTEANSISSAEAQKFLEEALRMREFDHPHILRLIGIALDKEDMPLVVLPYMKHGDLLTYIRDERNHPTVKDLMDFGIQIAQGMSYLSKLKFVHRDLAARNCMLDDFRKVKVADFGLSRDIYERDYYSSDDRKAKLPVKWMALESLEKGTYNIKTDVWSYGVVLFELMTRGVQPYPEVDNWDIIKFLKSGRRMPQPSYCPDQLYQIMLECWHYDASCRPTFPDLVVNITKIIQMMEDQAQQSSVGLNITYINVPTSQSYLYPATQPYAARDQRQINSGGSLQQTSSHSANTAQRSASVAGYQRRQIISDKSRQRPLSTGANLRMPVNYAETDLLVNEQYEGAVGGSNVNLDGDIYASRNSNYNNNNKVYGVAHLEPGVYSGTPRTDWGSRPNFASIYSTGTRPKEYNTNYAKRHHSNAGAYGSAYKKAECRRDKDTYQSMPSVYAPRLQPYYSTPRVIDGQQTVSGSKSTLV